MHFTFLPQFGQSSIVLIRPSSISVHFALPRTLGFSKTLVSDFFLPTQGILIRACAASISACMANSRNS